jgi:hypothetical protein
VKGPLIVAAILVAFAGGVYGLWRMVGGQVEVAGVRAEQTVNAEVEFSLASPDGRPVSDAPVRLVFGPSPERQSPAAGHTATTDSTGRVRVATSITMDKQPRQRPTNFVDSLFTRAEATDHLVVGAELDYMTFRWLYVIELFRFQQGGDIVVEGPRLFTRDEQGRFSREANSVDGGWDIADLGGMRLTTAGHELTAFALEPKDGAAGTWTVSLTFVRQPEPVRR